MRSYGEALLFQEDAIDTLHESKDYGPEALERIASSYENTNDSTAFSGIRAAETADTINLAVLEKKLGRKINRVPPAWMIKWGEHCRAEVLAHAKRDGTLFFGDISNFFKKKVLAHIKQFMTKPGMIIEVIAEIQGEGNGPMQLTSHCYTHDRECTIRSTHRHTAGTSCHPFSAKGLRMGLSDPEMLYTIAWVCLVPIKLEIADITSENVESKILLELLKRFCKDKYFIDIQELDPVFLGVPFARNRSFIRMRHKCKILSQVSPLSQFVKRFQRAVDFSWKSAWFMMMRDNLDIKGVITNERNADLAAKQTVKTSKNLGGDLTCHDSDAFFRVLTPYQSELVIAYGRRWPNQAFQLNQDATVKQAGHSNEWALQTFIHNFGDLWLDDVPEDGSRRWMFAAESLQAIGFPIIPMFAKRYGREIFSSFNLPDKKRDSNQVRAQVGNSMNVAVMSLLALHSRASYIHRPLPQSLINLYNARKRQLSEANEGPGSTKSDAPAIKRVRHRVKSVPRV